MAFHHFGYSDDLPDVTFFGMKRDLARSYRDYHPIGYVFWDVNDVFEKAEEMGIEHVTYEQAANILRKVTRQSDELLEYGKDFIASMLQDIPIPPKECCPFCQEDPCTCDDEESDTQDD